MANKKLEVRGNDVRIKIIDGKEMFSLTDIAKQFGEGRAAMVIHRWFKNSDTLDYLKTYEIEFGDSKVTHMDDFKNQFAKKSDGRTIEDWVNLTGTKFMKVERGRYGGTWATFNIASDFMMWISPKFKVWFMKDYEVMKRKELLAEKNLDKFFAQKNIDNLLEILHNEQDRFEKLNQETKKLE